MAASDWRITAGSPDNALGQQQERVPRWPAAIAVLVVAGAYLFLSERLTLGPPWLLLLAIVILLVALEATQLRGQRILPRGMGLGAVAVATLAVGYTTALLASDLLTNNPAGSPLLEGAAAIWASNVLTFAVWYWEIDGGGPAARTGAKRYSSDFLFPQMTQPPRESGRSWAPTFLDYLFLAFTTGATFAPSDTPVLSARAKVLMMCQATISLIDVVVLLSRAINVLR